MGDGGWGGRYAANAERLVRRGFRVVVVEQTETPEMLAERKRRDKSVKDKVVRREAVAVRDLTLPSLAETKSRSLARETAFPKLTRVLSFSLWVP